MYHSLQYTCVSIDMQCSFAWQSSTFLQEEDAPGDTRELQGWPGNVS